MKEYENLREQIRNRMQERLEYCDDMEDEAVYEMIMEEMVEWGKQRYIPLHIKQRLCKEVYYAVRKYDILQELMDDNRITEIMVNGPDCIFIEKDGKIQRYHNRFSSKEN